MIRISYDNDHIYIRFPDEPGKKHGMSFRTDLRPEVWIRHIKRLLEALGHKVLVEGKEI